MLVVRGDVLDEILLRRDAERFRRRFPAWGRTGVSAFYARDGGEVHALCQLRLGQFPSVVVFKRYDLEQMGLEVIGTFRAPHVTLAAADTDDLVERLRACPHSLLINPYHEAEPPEEML